MKKTSVSARNSTPKIGLTVAALAAICLLPACASAAPSGASPGAAAPEIPLQSSATASDISNVKVCPTAPDPAMIEKVTGLKVANPYESESSAICRYNNADTLTVLAFQMDSGDKRTMWAGGADVEKVGAGSDLLSVQAEAYSVLRDGVTYTVSLNSKGVTGDQLKTYLQDLMAAWGHA